MIKACTDADFETMLSIINSAAEAYGNVIPEECYHKPYMSAKELNSEIIAGVKFFGCFESEKLIGVMGSQRVMDATLIRHAYVSKAFQGKSIGSAMLKMIVNGAHDRILVGTWAAAVWAIRFYSNHHFVLVDEIEKNKLLKKYWNISEQQVKNSLVLEYRKI